MSWVDAGIVVVFLFFIVTAFKAGFIREVIGIVAAVLGVVTAGLFYEEVADTLLAPIDNEIAANVVGFLIVFVGITVAGQLLAALIHPVVVIMQLGIADQLLGAVFGAAKAFVIIEALLILFITFEARESTPGWYDDVYRRIEDSEFASVMLDAADPIAAILPDNFETSIEPFEQQEIDPLR